MKILLEPGRKYLGLFTFLKALLRIKKSIAYINFILTQLNYFDYLYDRKNGVTFKVKYNDLISKAILKYGSYEENSLMLVRNALKMKPGYFLDIGANFGLYTIYASKVPGVKTIAIDGLPEAFSLLLDNIELNNLKDNVIPCNLLLSSEKHFACFGHHDKGNLGSSRIKKAFRTDIPKQYIADTTTLDSLLEFVNIDCHSISFIKIDIEGHEFELLKTCTLFEKARPAYILIEMLEENEHFDEIMDYFLSYNFLPYTIAGMSYKPGVPIPECNLLFIDGQNLDTLLRVYDR